MILLKQSFSFAISEGVILKFQGVTPEFGFTIFFFILIYCPGIIDGVMTKSGESECPTIYREFG